MGIQFTASDKGEGIRPAYAVQGQHRDRANKRVSVASRCRLFARRVRAARIFRSERDVEQWRLEEHGSQQVEGWANGLDQRTTARRRGLPKRSLGEAVWHKSSKWHGVCRGTA